MFKYVFMYVNVSLCICMYKMHQNTSKYIKNMSKINPTVPDDKKTCASEKKSKMMKNLRSSDCVRKGRLGNAKAIINHWIKLA